MLEKYRNVGKTSKLGGRGSISQQFLFPWCISNFYSSLVPFSTAKQGIEKFHALTPILMFNLELHYRNTNPYQDYLFELWINENFEYLSRRYDTVQ